MRTRPLIWQIFSSYFLIIVLAVLIITGYTSRSIQQFFHAQIIADLQVRARVTGDRVLEKLIVNSPDLQPLCRELGPEINARITVVLPSGVVAADSEEDPTQMENHGDRPEIQQAIQDRAGSAVRFSHTMNKNMMYVALPLKNNSQMAGVVRVAFPLTRLQNALSMVYAKTITGGVITVILALLVSWYIARKLSRPLNEMKSGAERFAQGDFSQPVALPKTQEMSRLAQALNLMAAQMDDRIQTVVSQRNQQEAVLSSMVEGVIALDGEQRVISLNQAAARLIGVPFEQAQGQLLTEIIGNPSLKAFVLHSLETSAPMESEISVQGQETQILQAHGSVLRDAQGEEIGAVVVLNDITRLRRLEQVRRDFVANVSHELRTPITSIKGFVETLLDGAMDSPEDARRFLQIIAKQADRLNAILGDLLTLSRIEEEERKSLIQIEQGSLYDALTGAIQQCEGKAEEKNMHIVLECDPAIAVPMNASLIEQAVANLIDNAVKFSDSGKEVLVAGIQTNEETIIRVEDHGCGIPAEYLPRLFERFYRVDKARSRSMGGTGLGLSIVKHIAKAHGGHVTVESTVGHGSMFSIHLPK
ncbi:MAG TPA: ATP-binding protein [Candidatus Hydrogenedentes bacterium]|nr:ATP-binding protein [Candidatus Hydrogenedentota bacterium]